MMKRRDLKPTLEHGSTPLMMHWTHTKYTKLLLHAVVHVLCYCYSLSGLLQLFPISHLI